MTTALRRGRWLTWAGRPPTRPAPSDRPDSPAPSARFGLLARSSPSDPSALPNLPDPSARPAQPTPPARSGWREWRRRRPFMAGLLLGLGGVEVICVSWVGLGFLRFTGTAGAASWALGALFVVAGVTTWHNPSLRYFSGVLGAVMSLVSLVAANLGGLLLGFVLTAVGSALALAWVPRRAPSAPQRER